MSSSSTPKRSCSKCDEDRSPTICSGCDQQFCFQHADEHRKDLRQQIEKIERDHDALKQKHDPVKTKNSLLANIKQWEDDSINEIKRTAETVWKDVKKLTDKSSTRLSSLTTQITSEVHAARTNKNITEKEVDSLKKQFDDFQKQVDKLLNIKIQMNESTTLRLITIESSSKREQNNTDVPMQNAASVEDKQKPLTPSKLLRDDDQTTDKAELPSKLSLLTMPQSSTYPSVTFGLTESVKKDIHGLFKKLMSLPTMDKDGPMSGKCLIETDQMEQFLIKTFGFENDPGKYIVQGVRLFHLTRPPHSLNPTKSIYFPRNTANSFAMTVQEITDWQRSFKVYASKDINGMSTDFLRVALQGKSLDGEEAFRMKFVVRISTCPILMEFDAKVISRNVDEPWPNNIKLVSVTGIDFAGRKHDVGDILYYVSNWKDVFEVDHRKNEPALLNERDFAKKIGGALGKLYENRLLSDLTLMARLRLQACDREGIQIVVETGIGLGVFSGKHIGVDITTRITSAIAVRTVLEEDGPNYKNIRALVFALPTFDKIRTNHRTDDTFDNFVEHFQEPEYTGCIPVLIADQDMHRLTVAIARQGFIVSELNPADSHGVFGEYWQNRGPAVEEKLALTTAGLLVQHHLINPQVLDLKNYLLI